jgi:hypothetical protein
MSADYEVKGECVWITLHKTKWELEELKQLIQQIQEDLE